MIRHMFITITIIELLLLLFLILLLLVVVVVWLSLLAGVSGRGKAGHGAGGHDLRMSSFLFWISKLSDSPLSRCLNF